MTSLRTAVGRSLRPSRRPLVVVVVGALALAACGGGDESTSTTAVGRTTINVGRTIEPGSELVAEIYGQGLENAGYRIGRKDPVADRAATMAALQAGSVQLVPELSATLLAFLSAGSGNGATAVTVDDQITAITATLADGLALGPVSGAEATTVVACSQAAIAENSLATITDLAAVAADVIIGAPASFETAPAFGLDALNEAYEATFELTVVEPDEASAELAAGSIDCAVVPQTLADITIDGLIALDDDQSLFPLDVVVPLMTAPAATPELVAVLTQINGTLTTDVLRALLVKAVVSGESYAVIAKQFLASLSSGQ